MPVDFMASVAFVPAHEAQTPAKIKRLLATSPEQESARSQRLRYGSVVPIPPPKAMKTDLGDKMRPGRRPPLLPGRKSLK